MKAAVITAPGKIEITSVADPDPGRGEVVVEVSACGLCGTDLNILQGEFAASLPVVPGHEFSGVVVALGAGGEGLRVGDRVAADPHLPCHECRFCRAGHANLCLRYQAIGVTEPGAAAQYVAVPAANCVLVPDGVELADATLIEPLSCAVRGYDVLRTRLGAHVLVYGAGTMGLMMLEMAKRVGAASVDVVDVNPDRLAVARELGASRVSGNADEFDEDLGWNVVVDATGNQRAIQDGIGRVAPAGTFLQFGVAAHDARVTIEPYRIYNKEITITGSMAVLHSYERAAELFNAGVLDPRVFITDRFPLDEYEQAIGRFQAGSGLKTQVLP
jgi:2-desacetyl-2-hydroxyethyl bacteriochlorophyllide A dehydrogenase